MCIFIDHILAGRQFEQPLTIEERQFFSLLRDEVSSMCQLCEVPYKAAVVLSLKFTYLYELLLKNKIYDDLNEEKERGFLGQKYRAKVRGVL